MQSLANAVSVKSDADYIYLYFSSLEEKLAYMKTAHWRSLAYVQKFTHGQSTMLQYCK